MPYFLFNVHYYKLFAMQRIHIVYIWVKVFEYIHVYVMLKWDVLGSSFMKRSHRSQSHLCILFSCNAILICLVYGCS